MKHALQSSLVLTGALLLGGVSLSAAAQDSDGTRAERMRAELQKRFTSADTNADGRLTREEAKDKMPMVHRNFDAIDAEKTGAVGLEQIATFALKQRGRR